MCALKKFIQDFKHIDFLKLDIEGAELHVLQDISSELHRVKHLFIEYHEPQKAIITNFRKRK
jgi:FkbM family methyltransferase